MSEKSWDRPKQSSYGGCYGNAGEVRGGGDRGGFRGGGRGGFRGGGRSGGRGGFRGGRGGSRGRGRGGGKPQPSKPLDAFTLVEVREAQKQARMWNSRAEYHWGSKWETYANAIQRWYRTGEGGKPPSRPINPGNLQMNKTKYKRPSTFQNNN